jgi:hypothetical protein
MSRPGKVTSGVGELVKVIGKDRVSVDKDTLREYAQDQSFTSIYGPKIGPNFHLLVKKVKNIFDPGDMMNPGKLVNM